MQISLAKLGLWSLIVVVIATVVFAVLQPLIWDLLDRTPPTTTTDLGNLLAVMVAVVGLGIAALGGVTYTVLKDRMEADLTRKAHIRDSFLLARMQQGLSWVYWRQYQPELDREMAERGSIQFHFARPSGSTFLY